MYNVSIKKSLHSFEKKNLVTISSKGRKGGYDILECSKCGIQGKRYSLTTVEISEAYSKEKAFLCPNASAIKIPQKIKVIYCNAKGKAFSNLIPNSEHEVVSPPDGYKNDHTGVWVMGVGEPVKLLSEEFYEI